GAPDGEAGRRGRARPGRPDRIADRGQAGGPDRARPDRLAIPAVGRPRHRRRLRRDAGSRAAHDGRGPDTLQARRRTCRYRTSARGARKDDRALSHMLFEKIRRTQKPVFIFLGAVFALSFVFLGVGSGVGGISLGDLLGTSTSSGASISSLNDKVRKNPQDAASWLVLRD